MKKKILSPYIWILLICAVPAFVWGAGFGGFTRGNAFNQPVDISLTSIAGPDRVVMLEGKTYLNGYAGYNQPGRSGTRRRGQLAELPILTPEPAVLWSKESGPGTVTF